MTLIKQILKGKGEVYTISNEATVYDALVLMAQKNVGALVVVDGAEVTGIISERDYARKVILRSLSSKELSVGTIMTKGVVCIDPNRSVVQCLALMTDKRIRHLPVMDGDKLVGVVSIGDLVKARMAEQDEQIEQYEGYVRGG